MNDSTSQLGPVGMAIFVIIAIAVYIYYAYCLSEIAKKTNTPNEWYAWIPILNMILMLQIARQSLWWFFGMLVPFVNLIVIAWVWAKIAQVRNRPWWWGILMLINPVNLVLMWFLAFREGTTPPTPVEPTSPPVIA